MPGQARADDAVVLDAVTPMGRGPYVARANRPSDPITDVHLHPFGRRGHEVLSLVEEHGGDLSRTVLCHLDVCMKVQLDRFGGPGYDHIWSNVRPALRPLGVGPGSRISSRGGSR